MIKNNIKATNSRGDTFQFDNVNRIVDGLNLSGLGASINRTETTAPGSVYQNTRLNERSGDLLVHLYVNGATQEVMDMRREQLYRVFNPETNPIRLEFENSEGVAHYMTIQITATPFMGPGKSDYNAAYQKMLIQWIATDPYIYVDDDANGTGGMEEIAAWVPNFKFDLEIPDPGIELEYREQSLVATIDYKGSSDTGMIVKFVANGPVTNPYIQNVVTFEKIQLNISMIAGDIIEVNTEKGNRSIIGIRNGVRTNIFYSYSLVDSTFITLSPGDNSFTYGASSGMEALDIYIYYRTKKVGL